MKNEYFSFLSYFFNREKHITTCETAGGNVCHGTVCYRSAQVYDVINMSLLEMCSLFSNLI